MEYYKWGNLYSFVYGQNVEEVVAHALEAEEAMEEAIWGSKASIRSLSTTSRFWPRHYYFYFLSIGHLLV